MLETISNELCEYFFIPCDLCHKYFNKEGACPECVEKCNGEHHWKLLLERICSNEED